MKQFMEPEVKLEMFRVEDIVTTSFDDGFIPCDNEGPFVPSN